MNILCCVRRRRHRRATAQLDSQLVFLFALMRYVFGTRILIARCVVHTTEMPTFFSPFRLRSQSDSQSPLSFHFYLRTYLLFFFCAHANIATAIFTIHSCCHFPMNTTALQITRDRYTPIDIHAENKIKK